MGSVSFVCPSCFDPHSAGQKLLHEAAFLPDEEIYSIGIGLELGVNGAEGNRDSVLLLSAPSAVSAVNRP